MGSFLSTKGGNDEASVGERAEQIQSWGGAAEVRQKKHVAARAAPVPLIMSQYVSFQKDKLLRVTNHICQTRTVRVSEKGRPLIIPSVMVKLRLTSRHATCQSFPL